MSTKKNYTIQKLFKDISRESKFLKINNASTLNDLQQALRALYLNKFEDLKKIDIFTEELNHDYINLMLKISFNFLDNIMNLNNIVRNEGYGEKCFENFIKRKQNKKYEKNGNIAGDFFKSLSNWINNNKEMKIQIRSHGNSITYLYCIFPLLSNSGYVNTIDDEAHITVNEYGKNISRYLIKMLSEKLSEDSNIYKEFIEPAIIDLNKEIEGEIWHGIKNDLNDNKNRKISNFFWLMILLSDIAWNLHYLHQNSLIRKDRQSFSSLYTDKLIELSNSYKNQILDIDFFKSKNLSDFYVAQGFDKVNISSEKLEPMEEEYQYNFFEFYPKKKNIIIFGTSGYGKTTFLHALSLYFNNISVDGFEKLDLQVEKFPIYVDCSKITVIENNSDNYKIFQDYLDISLKNIFKKCDYNSNTMIDIIKYYSENETRGNIVLILDGVDELKMPINDVDEKKMIKVFMKQLKVFLDKNPNMHCIISSTTKIFNYPELLEFNFSPIFLHRFSKKNILDFCEKWYKQIDKSKTTTSVYNLIEKIGEEICSISSLRRIFHRPLYLEYYLSIILRDSWIFRPKNPLYFINRLIDNSITFLLNKRIANDISEHNFSINQDDINLLVSYIACEIIESKDIALKDKEFNRALEDALTVLKPYLSFTVTERTIDFLKKDIFGIASNNLWFIKFKKVKNENDELFSFASITILNYFAALGISKGIMITNNGTQGKWSDDPEYQFKYIENNIEKWSENKLFFNECVELISWIICFLERRGEKIVEFIIEKTRDDSVNNRNMRILSVCVLTNILSLGNYLKIEIVQNVYRAIFENYFYKEQLKYFHDFINTTSINKFVDFVFKEFTNSVYEPFPKFIWLIGYIDYLELNIYKENSKVHRNIYSDQKDSLRKQLKTQNLGDTFNHLTLLENINRLYDNGDYKKEDNYKLFVREVLVLATIFWIELFDTENMKKKDNHDFYEKSLNCLLKLLNCTKSCVSNISCYALAHLVKGNVVCEADIIKVIKLIIEIDYNSRLSVKKQTNLYLNYRKFTQPLCGALRLITVLSNEEIEKIIGKIVVSNELLEFYRKEWKCCLEDTELRYPALIFKICYIIKDLWSKEELEENKRFLSEAKSRNGIKFLKYDEDSSSLWN